MKASNKKATSAVPKKPNLRVRFFRYIGSLFSKMFSTFRFSLTLRIAVHSSLQLIRSVLMIALIFTVVYTIAQTPVINRTFETIEAITPANGDVFLPEQLTRLSVNSAYYTEDPYTDDFYGFIDRVALTVGNLFRARFSELTLYRSTGRMAG